LILYVLNKLLLSIFIDFQSVNKLYLKSDLRTYVFGLKRDSHFRKENINTQMFASFFLSIYYLKYASKDKMASYSSKLFVVVPPNVYLSIYLSLVSFVHYVCTSPMRILTMRNKMC